jgi:hypothetical protein
MTGDVCFKKSGGWTIDRKYELDSWCETQVADLVEEIQKLCEKKFATLSEPLKSMIIVDLKVKAKREAALAAAEAGHKIPGVLYLPKHETDRMMIGTDRRPWSLTKLNESLNAALKELKNACTDVDEEQ